VGVRFVPWGAFLDAYDSKPYELFTYCVKEASKRGVAYVHMVEPRVHGNADTEPKESESLVPFKEVATVPFIAAGGFTRETAAAKISSGEADLVWCIACLESKLCSGFLLQ
jgi:2,4-dienoyl-CoA reductase-like NADH-dependent reductase (Old Yellow Enzyme family)